ncbi:MAG: type IV pilus assembly protein PilV [Lentisphaeria bacterium]|jgi:type IV pilus assembly protein PilV
MFIKAHFIRKPRNAVASSGRFHMGSTMIEVLVSLLVLATGLLGMASLLTTGITLNQEAYFMTRVSFLSNDILDRMRVNPSQISLIGYGTSGDGAKCTSGCEAAAIRDNDLYEWKTALKEDLPGGEGEITVVEGTPNEVTIKLKWSTLAEEVQTFTLVSFL